MLESPLSRSFSCVGDRRAHAPLVVEADEHAPRLRREPAAGEDLVLELDALRPDPRAARAHLDVLADVDLRAEVDLDAGEDHRAEPAERIEPRLLEIGRVDGVVDVPERVDVAKADALVDDEREVGSRGRCYRASMWAILGGLGAAVCWSVTTLTAARASRLIGSPATLAWVMLTGFVVVAPIAFAQGKPVGLDGTSARLARAGGRWERRRPAPHVHRASSREGLRGRADRVRGGRRRSPDRGRGGRVALGGERRWRWQRSPSASSSSHARPEPDDEAGHDDPRAVLARARRGGVVRGEHLRDRPGEPRPPDRVGGASAPGARRRAPHHPARSARPASDRRAPRCRTWSAAGWPRSAASSRTPSVHGTGSRSARCSRPSSRRSPPLPRPCSSRSASGGSGSSASIVIAAGVAAVSALRA